MRRAIPILVIVAASLLLFTGAGKVFLTIGTGGTAGTYYPLGGAMAEILNKAIPDVNATAVSTGASVANLNGLEADEFQMVISQNDVTFYAYTGTELFAKSRAMFDLRGIACLYNETVQIVALASSGIKTLADLKGKKVVVGAIGSGTEVNARQILETAGHHLQRHQRAVPVVRRGGERPARRQHRRGRSTPRASRPRPSATSRRRRTS